MGIRAKAEEILPGLIPLVPLVYPLLALSGANVRDYSPVPDHLVGDHLALVLQEPDGVFKVS